MDGSSRTMTNCAGSSEPVRLFTPWSDLKKEKDSKDTEEKRLVENSTMAETWNTTFELP